MKEKKKITQKLKSFFKLIHLQTILAIFGFYLLLCVICYIVLVTTGTTDYSFWDVLVFNILTLTGNDYVFTDNIQARIVGIIILIFSMITLSVITGIISSSMVESRLNSGRGIRKMQSLNGHIIICGWEKDIKNLVSDILRKNKNLKTSNIVIITTADEDKVNALLDDAEMKGLHYLKGDYTEEQSLLNANVKKASKVLILGENTGKLDPELIDSRVFVSTLMVRNLNAKCHICSEVKTERYKNYLEAQNCAEVVYTDAYTRYILSTSTNYSGISKVLASFLDNGDGHSIQICPIAEKWIGKTYGELFTWYKKEKDILLLGVLENMGFEKDLKHHILSEAQKSTNYGEIIQKLKTVKSLETNCPRLNPADDLILTNNMGAIIIGEEI